MPNVPRPDTPDAYLPRRDEESRDIISKINGGLSFGRGVHTERAGNMDAQWLRHTFPGTANVEVALYHGLGRVPIGYDVCEIDQAASIYSSRKGSWTDTVMYLKSDGKGFSVLLRVY